MPHSKPFAHTTRRRTLTSKKITVGSKVRYRSNQGTDEEAVEVGVVIHICLSDNNVDNDAYVAFFGPTFPEGPPTERPYILRYYVGNLELVDD